MISKLQSGEYLKKDWLNAVAEKTNAEVPSTGSFINTTNGTLFDPGTSNTVTNYRPFVETMFQCSYCAAFEITARNDDAVDEFDTSKTRLTFKMRLGPTVSDIKSNVKYEETLDDVFILNNDQPNMTICLSDNKILSSAMTNNYIDLAAYDKSEVEVKVIKVELSSEQQQQQQQQQTQRKPRYVLGIGPAGKTSYEEILKRQQYSKYDKATVVKSCTVAKLDNNKKMYQLEIGVIDLREATDVKIPDGDSDVNWESEELSTVEPRLSSIHRNEISGTSYYQLYKFGLSDNVQLSDLSDVQADVLVRKINGKDHTLEYVALSSLSSVPCSADSEIAGLNLSSISVANTEGDGKVYQLYNFDKYTTTGKDELSAYNPAVLVRKIDGNYHTLEYVALSDISAEGTSCSADSEVEALSSIGVLSNDNGKVYELYNFDKMSSDINAKIWTLGDLDSDKRGKTGKLIDPTTKKLLSVDILVRDNSTKQLKYMNLSVDPINVDTYSTNTKNKSIVYYTDKFQDRDYLTLYDFNTTPKTVLSATISNNGLVDVTGQNTWILTKKYNPSNQMMELTYDKLQLSVNLSSIQGACISGDTNVITTRKSIDTKTEGNNTYHQLHNFDNPNPTTKTVDMRAKNTAYDTLDSNEYFVIKSGNELKYKKVQIKDNTPGGGGSTTGYSGNVYGDPRLKYNTNGQYQIELWAKKMTYANGLLTNVGDEELVSTLPTTPLTQEIL